MNLSKQWKNLRAVCSFNLASKNKMESIAENVIYEIWMTFSEKLFQRIVEVTGLNEEQADALRRAVLRPNDFVVHIIDDTSTKE